MKNRLIILLCIGIFLLINNSKSAYGQYYDNNQAGTFFGNFSINGNVGVALPFADISQDFNPYQDDWKMAYGFALRKQFSPILGLGLKFTMGDLRGTHLTANVGDPLNRFFEAEFMDINLHSVVNISNLLFGFKENRSVLLYGTLGVGISNWASVLRYQDTNNQGTIASSGFDAKDQKAWTPVLSIPAGLGLYFALGKKVGFNLEGTVHRLNSDELDAFVSGKSKQDYYSYISAGITYNLSGVSNVFRRANRNETDYEKEQRKLEKFQERKTRKNRRDEDREKMERDRRSNIQKAKKERKTPDAGMPKVVEYDAVYSYDAIQKIKDQGKSQFGGDTETAEGNIKGQKELVFDEGKHFITGGATGTTGSANIISAKDALKLKTNTYESITVTDGAGRSTTTTIHSGGVQNIPLSGKIYTVQILASRVAANNIGTYRERYGIQQPIYYSFINGLYRYSAGLFTNYYDAQTYANVLKRNGLGDAFVATYNNGVRVTK